VQTTFGRMAGTLNFHNLRMAHKLLVGFSLVTALLVIGGLLGVASLGRGEQRLVAMYNANLVRTQHLNEVSLEYKDALATLDLTTDPADLAEIADDDGELLDAWEAYQSYDMTGREGLVATFDESFAAFRKVRDEAGVPAILARDRAAFESARTEALELAEPADDALEELMMVEQRAAAHSLEDARAMTSFARLATFGFIGLAVLLSVALALGIARMIAGPLRRTVEVLRALAAGRLDQRLPVGGRDEVGEMAAALNAAMERLSAAMGRIGGESAALNDSADQLSAVSARMTDSAAKSSTQAGATAASADEVSRNVEVLVGGAAQMTTSIQEIAQNATRATAVAEQAVDVATRTNETIAKLGESSVEIGSVVKVINSLAEQTNLLALNATIEAARAGESGKGFAVVASEVKELAQATSKATGDVTARIESIQTNTAAAVTAIGQITSIITQINETQTTIAAAVEEQSITTEAISRNVDQAAAGSSRIADGMAVVADSAQNTTAEARNAAESASDLSATAANLSRLVGEFRY
jgi:methyl-accepting chemotaxis protein